MKNILIKILFGVTLMPVLVHSQPNTMYFCCSHLSGGGCSPVGFDTHTACEAGCTGETNYCDVRSIPTTPAPMAPAFAPPMVPYGYPAAYGGGVMGYQAGYPPLIGPGAATVGAAFDATAQMGVQPSGVPVTTTTTVVRAPVQQATSTAMGTPAVTGAVTGAPVQQAMAPVMGATQATAANTVGTGTAATSVPGNQVR